MKKNLVVILLLSLILTVPVNLYAQKVDIVPYLKQIESGERNKAEEALQKLQKEYPDDPAVMFLEGVLTQNGQEAVAVYNKIIRDYPSSKYADAALYRVYSYYYALGMYGAANEKLARLKKDYPESPYLEIVKKDSARADSSAYAEEPGKDTAAAAGVPDTSRNTEKDYNYTIQAGAFSVLQNAKSLSDSFRQYGYFSKIEDKVVAGTTFHIVFVGRFANEDDARKMLQLINTKFELNGRVIKTN